MMDDQILKVEQDCMQIDAEMAELEQKNKNTEDEISQIEARVEISK